MNKKYIEAITKLMKLTYDGRIIWEPSEESVGDKYIDDVYIDDIFTTKIKGVIFKLTKYATKTIRVGVCGRNVDKDPRGFHTYIKLEIVKDDSILYSFPYTSALWDLLRAIRSCTTDIDMILDDIINENI